jgi:inorganic pyrophosphatase
MVCVSAPTFPGIVIPVKVLGVFRTRDEAGQDDKLLCVPQEDPNWNGMEELEDVPETLRTEIEHFWAIYKEPEGKPVEIQGWADRGAALEIIDEGRRLKREQS